MTLKLALKTIAATSIFTWTGAAFSHDSHGLSGVHWHANDAWGFMVMGALMVTAIWLRRSGK